MTVDKWACDAVVKECVQSHGEGFFRKNPSQAPVSEWMPEVPMYLA